MDRSPALLQRQQMMQEWKNWLDEWRELATEPQNPPMTEELTLHNKKHA
ncbi:hypothetical protein [Chania multitudinisentens]|nr:hypothetical protein [Chania multitudinisentens]